MTAADFFSNPSAWGILLALLFGAIWLAPFRPFRLNKWSTWAIFAGGIIVFIPSILYIQAPLQNIVSSLLASGLGQGAYLANLLLTGIPLVLISGLVQEGAKLFPTVIFWQYHRRTIDPKLGLILGAMAGAGFGIIEAQWIHNMILASGWTFETAGAIGITAYAGFWERFFTVCFHISVSALAGWGLAKGWGWQFYLIASFAHGFVNYSAILTQMGVFNNLMAEIFVALCAVIVFMIAMHLRWRKSASDC